MDLRQAIKPYQEHPISHQVLLSLLKGYKRPNDKISELLKKGDLIALKKGIYLWQGENQNFPEPFAIANALYGPSYVSAESALSFHGLIPEQVFTVLSMTLKPAKSFTNDLGTFEYKKLTAPYYSFGVEYRKLRDSQFALIASPEKALCDKIIMTPRVLFRSLKEAQTYLINDLRIEPGQLRELDSAAIQSWLPEAPKKESLDFLVKTITVL